MNKIRRFGFVVTIRNFRRTTVDMEEDGIKCWINYDDKSKSPIRMRKVIVLRRTELVRRHITEGLTFQ